MNQDAYLRSIRGQSVGDPINDLGLAMRRPIPKGQARIQWLKKPGVLDEVVATLRNQGYFDNRLARAVFDLSLGEIRMPLLIDTADAHAALMSEK